MPELVEIYGRVVEEMKYDRNMSADDFIKLTGKMLIWFPWRLCCNPAFRTRIFNFLERGASRKEIFDDCTRNGVECYFFRKKNAESTDSNQVKKTE